MGQCYGSIQQTNGPISVASVAVGIAAARVLLRLPGNAAGLAFDTEQTSDFRVTKLLPHFRLFLGLFLIFRFLFCWLPTKTIPQMITLIQPQKKKTIKHFVLTQSCRLTRSRCLVSQSWSSVTDETCCNPKAIKS